MKNIFSRMFGSLRKRLAASAIVALAVALPVAVSAASLVNITADTTVANATKSAGTMQWSASTSAAYNEVVAVQVVYNNTEDPSSTKTADNLRVKINIPTTAGVNQTVTTTTSADNSNKVTGSASVTLDSANAYLEYIPGTATWKHASTANGPMTVTQPVSDAVVTSPNGLVLGNENPCQAGSIVVQARVIVPGTKVVKQVEKASETGKWATTNTANPGDVLKYMITYTNTGNNTANNVIVRDNLPPYLTYVPNTTYVFNGSNPSGALDKSNAVTTDGIIIGNYAPGITAYVTLEAKVADESALPCGVTRLTNVGIAHPTGTPEYYNTAYTDVNHTCTPPPVTPVYSCDLLGLSAIDTNGVKATVSYTANNGATYKSASFDWGDGSAATSGPSTSASHTYGKDGTYTVTATVTFTVNGADKAVTSANCAKQITIKTPPTPPVTPVYSCDLLTLSAVDTNSVKAVVGYTAKDGATYKSASFNWGDGFTTSTTTDTANHTFAKDGTYTVTATTTFTVNGADKAVTSANCAKQITIKTPPTPPATPVYSCDLLSLSAIDTNGVKASVSYTAKDGATYKSASFNWGDSSDATSGAATTASHTYAKDGTYTVVATITFSVNGTDKAVSSDKCSQNITIKTPPTPPATPVYTCNMLSISQGDNRAVTASVAYTAQGGASLKMVTFDWGDGSTPLSTSDTTAQYTYAKDGTYTIAAKLVFSVNGQDAFVQSDNCVKQVSFTTPTPPVTPPGELPNTGAGSVIGIFAGVVVASTLGYRLFLSRKLAR